MSRLLLLLACSLLSTFAATAWADDDLDPARRLEVAVSPGYSLGLGHGYGGQLGLTHGWRALQGERSAVHADLGLLFSYQREPYAPANRFQGEGVSSGATHRLQLLAYAGHSHRIGKQRRMLLACHLFAGPVRAALRGHLDNALYEVSGDYVVDAWTFSTGVAVAQGVAISDRLTLLFELRGPLPYAPAAVSGYLFASLGVSMKL